MKLRVLYKLPQKIYVKICNFITLKNQSVITSSNPDIRGKIYIRNLGRTEFGRDLRINCGVFPNPVGANNNTVICVDPKAELIIGNNVGISNAEIVVKKKIVISDGVLIGGGVKIYDSDFHSLNVSERVTRENERIISESVNVGPNVFIGAYSIILKGVSIGENSIIGAGSVVTKSVPRGEIWAGNPAKFIRKIDCEGLI